MGTLSGAGVCLNEKVGNHYFYTKEDQLASVMRYLLQIICMYVNVVCMRCMVSLHIHKCAGVGECIYTIPWIYMYCYE